MAWTAPARIEALLNFPSQNMVKVNNAQALLIKIRHCGNRLA